MQYAEGKSRKIAFSSMPTKPQEPGKSSWTLYTTCNRLTVDLLIRCLCYKEYEALILTGNPTPEDLQQQWEKIYAEFSELMGDENYSIIKDYVKEINILDAKIKFAKFTLPLLYDYYCPEILKMLQGIGIKEKLNPDDEIAYYAGIDRIITKIKKMEVDLEELHIDFARTQDDNDEKQGTNEDFFDTTLNVLSKTQGYHIKPADITVTRFVKLYHALKKANQLNSLRNGG